MSASTSPQATSAEPQLTKVALNTLNQGDIVEVTTDQGSYRLEVLHPLHGRVHITGRPIYQPGQVRYVVDAADEPVVHLGALLQTFFQRGHATPVKVGTVTGLQVTSRR
jgi:hypothetical protein